MKLHEAQEKGIPKPCVNCGKMYEHPYGRWGDGGTCTKKCNDVQEGKEKYPEHSEEEFLKRFNLC